MKNPFTPDFNNAKVGDKCFSVSNDIVEIEDTFKYGIYAVSVPTGESFTGHGRFWESDKHPSLFNSFQQFLDYWAWEKDNGGVE